MNTIDEIIRLLFQRIENIQGYVDRAKEKSYKVLDEEDTLTPQNIEEELMKYLWEIVDEASLAHFLLHQLSDANDSGERTKKRYRELLRKEYK